MRNPSNHDAPSSRRRQPYRATHRTTTSLSLPTPTMDFFDDRIEHRSKKHKRAHSTSFPDADADDMAFFSPPANHFLQPSAPSRKKSQRFLQDEIDEFLESEDLEHSFASNVSLNSPPHNPVALTSDFDPMDISPAPPVRHHHHPHATQRPRAYTASSRLFGSDISNNNGTLMPSPTLVGQPIAAKPAPTQSAAKKTQRSALPTEWFRAPAAAPEPPSPAHIREPSSPMDDAMDVDTSYNIDPPVVEVSFSPPSAAPAGGAGFNQLFYDTASPSPRRSFESPAPPDNKKRRSLSPESMRRGGSAQQQHHHLVDSSPMQPESPSEAKLERMGKPGLQGLGAPSASFLKRPRRPVLSAMVQGSSNGHALSAYPDLPSASAHSNGKNAHLDAGHPRGGIPVRRAFSAFLPPSIYTDPEPEDDAESSFDGDGGVDMSSPAQAYSRRQQGKTIRRCDGTEDFRPLTGAVASPAKARMINQDSPSAKFMAAGLPGFGDNEAHGKILPCHRVTEDGLMRISSHTLDGLLDGKFDDKITDFHVIDCRFDYEYIGGHIPGAVNVNTTQAIEELLLGPSLTKPRPSVSGDNARKTVLVFHCEFSAKRAPTFAKHLRAKDRAMNNHMYPKIHYPEVYILEGGYCQYFKTSGARCQPPAYVTMDDPNHATSRREDLDQFRKAKFGRHKSYAYGDSAKSLLAFGQAASGTSTSSSSSMGQQPQQMQPKRNTVPSAGPQSLFAAATAARSRRGGANTNSCLVTLPEDGNVTADADDTDTDVGDSPCPPPVKATAFKTKKPGVRAGIVRAETYGPTRMAYCS
ncbi:hypothetical protein D9619_006032 [Psilocybe cf. subviscida]|uniref:M-phase inducer phosphatase n=1 Tax=Psilocybe cf. subviscida TaxID=2480587 RepID=A0A8H5FBU8_9AGAR|nr:hypothetical protein D9619_006032 [Psilocybe cf. subviscida]